MEALRNAGLGGKCVIIGGIIPDRDVPSLMEAGVSKVFHPGSSMKEISDFVWQETAKVRRQQIL
jgi:methylmalonyl-CoA mutase C-terminal domain/subunit